MSPLFEENVKQFNYWCRQGNRGSHILMGAYTHQEEFYKYANSRYSAEKIRDDYVLVGDL